MRLGQRSLGAQDALPDGRFGQQKCAGDLGRGQASQQTQCERDPRVGREHRMACDEDEAQQIVSDIIVRRLIHRGVLTQEFGFLRNERMLSLQQLEAPELIERTVFRGCHQPRSRVVGDAGSRPLLERGNQCVLRQLLGKPDVAQHPGKFGDDFRRLDAPHGLDAALNDRINHGHRSGIPASFEAGPQLANFDRRILRRRTLGGDRDGLLARLARQQKETPDHFLRFGERAVEYMPRLAAHLYASALIIALQ
jgi:hypothetical protein